MVYSTILKHWGLYLVLKKNNVNDAVCGGWKYGNIIIKANIVETYQEEYLPDYYQLQISISFEEFGIECRVLICAGPL